MADRRQVVNLLLAGRTGRQIMDELHMPPSKLRRTLAGRRLRDALEVERSVAETAKAIRTAKMMDAALGQLAEVIGGGNAESARKACMTIIDTAIGDTGRPDAEHARMPPRVAAQSGVERDSIGQNRAVVGSHGQLRAGELTCETT